MKRTGTVLSILLFLSDCFSLSAHGRSVSNDTTAGYEIRLSMRPFQQITVVLAHYYGPELKPDATAVLNEKSETVFSGNIKLHPGIYVIYDENRQCQLELLLGEDQHFSIQADIGENEQTIRFSHSPENEVFNRYKQFMAFRELEIEQYQAQLAIATAAKDSLPYIEQLKIIDDSIQQFRNDLIIQYPGSLLSSLLMAMKEPVLPSHLHFPVSPKDSLEARQYTKDHFWDGINFWDSRLLYTPFFEPKLEKYYTDIIERQPDSVIKHIDRMLGTAVANEEMTQFILGKLLFGSMYYKFKWEDAVFIHLFEKYVAQKTYAWLLPADRKTLTGHAYTLMANNKGTKATEISLPGLDGNKKSLLALKAKYTLLCFWDATCSHCRETLPVLDSFYRVSWKKKGLKLFAVSLESEGTREDWLAYIKQYHLEEWTHVYNSIAGEKVQAEKGEPLVLQPYNIWYFPSFYLLDENKRFMAKKLSYPQIAELINSILNKK